MKKLDPGKMRRLAEEAEAMAETEQAARDIEEAVGEEGAAAAGLFAMLFGAPQLGTRLVSRAVHRHAEEAVRRTRENEEPD